MLEGLEPFDLIPDNRVDHRPDWPDSPQHWWRYDSFCSLDRHPRYDCVSITATAYSVVRESEASVWVDYYGVIKRIQRDWNRKWAYPTKAEAWEAWKRRFSWRKEFHEREARRIAVIERTLSENEG